MSTTTRMARSLRLGLCLHLFVLQCHISIRSATVSEWFTIVVQIRKSFTLLRVFEARGWTSLHYPTPNSLTLPLCLVSTIYHLALTPLLNQSS